MLGKNKSVTQDRSKICDCGVRYFYHSPAKIVKSGVSIPLRATDDWLDRSTTAKALPLMKSAAALEVKYLFSSENSRLLFYKDMSGLWRILRAAS
jgi:hypothetical protein